ncbi:MBL fold metallo-hydrolase [Patescibacteria group bacterium]|nr:MBL fold metallo-hydrolase [Patescibacteria group bacterium]MBU4580629.1 MBL fold metallo-hydrolase [Patescibacteria group bacterium]
MTEIKILIQGYAKQIEGGWLANSTVALVKTSSKNIIVDPGCNREKLITALNAENLKAEDIDFVLLTHNHLDHTLLAGIFLNARVLTTEEIYKNDNQTAHGNIMHCTDLKIIQTPGHCNEHCSLVAPAENGVYVIAGDVFWWTDGETQTVDIEKIDDAHPQEVNMEKLIESRKKILKIADYIIPGHGKMFKVEK